MVSQLMTPRVFVPPNVERRRQHGCAVLLESLQIFTYNSSRNLGIQTEFTKSIVFLCEI